jgi:hypothetical protein
MSRDKEMEWNVLFFSSWALLSKKDWPPTHMAIPGDRQAQSVPCSTRHGSTHNTARSTPWSAEKQTVAHKPASRSMPRGCSRFAIIMTAVFAEGAAHFAILYLSKWELYAWYCLSQTKAVSFKIVSKSLFIYRPTYRRCIIQYVCMYVYSRGGPQTAPAPRPFLIYCAFPYT